MLLSAPLITGSTLYSARDFVDTIGPRVGQPVSRALIEQIGAEIQALYRRDGYVAPEIFAADSELASSTPRLHVFEAEIVEVAIRGDAGPHFETIQRAAGELQRQRIHKQRSLRFLRRIEELPGLALRASFERQSSDANGYVLVLSVSYDAVRASVAVHNRGTEDLGRTMLAGRMTLNGLLGAEEVLTLFAATGTNADRYRYVGARIERRWGRVGTQLDLSSSRAQPDADWRYASDRARLQLELAGFDDGVWRIDPAAALTARNSGGENALGVHLTETDTRSLEIGAAARRVSGGATTYLWSGFARGLDALGAASSAVYGDPAQLQFSKATLEMSHRHALSASWRLRADLDAQWSDDDLPAGERFTYGGSRFGRGFDPAALIGDSGTALSLQLERYQRWKHAWLRHSKAYIQADYGYAQDVRNGHEDAASVTAGLSANVRSLLTSLELSYPFLHPDYETDRSGLRAFVLMQMSF